MLQFTSYKTITGIYNTFYHVMNLDTSVHIGGKIRQKFAL